MTSTDYDPTHVILRIHETDRETIGSDAENLARSLEIAYDVLASARRGDADTTTAAPEWEAIAGQLHTLAQQITALANVAVRAHEATGGGPTGLARACGLAGPSSAQRLRERAARATTAPTVYDQWLTDPAALRTARGQDPESPRDVDRITLMGGIDAMIDRQQEITPERRTAILRTVDPVEMARAVLDLYAGLGRDWNTSVADNDITAVTAARITALRILADADRSHAARWHPGA